MMVKENLTEITATIRKTLQPRKEVIFAYVFGSRATGVQREGSDIDVAVYLNPAKKQEFFEIRLKLLEVLSRALPKEADILVLNTASPFMKYVVLQEGKLVLERNPDARLDFELKTLNEYFDYKPILEQYHNRLRTAA